MAATKRSRRINTLPLKFALSDRDISEDEIAFDLGYDPLYVAKVLRGMRPSDRFAEDVARHLSRSVSELFGTLEDEPAVAS